MILNFQERFPTEEPVSRTDGFQWNGGRGLSQAQFDALNEKRQFVSMIVYECQQALRRHQRFIDLLREIRKKLVRYFGCLLERSATGTHLRQSVLVPSSAIVSGSGGGDMVK